MSTCLGLNAMARIDKNDSEIAGRRARCHIARVLFVTRRVSNNKFSFRSREITVGYIDRDSLLTFGLKAVNEQREVDAFAGSARLSAVFFYRRELIFIDHFGVVEQASNERALAIIDAAAG